VFTAGSVVDALLAAQDYCVSLLFRAPAHGVQEAANMIDVITNAKGSFDVLGHAGTGPKISRESGQKCAPEQLLYQ
jgi:hypothetical protein